MKDPKGPSFVMGNIAKGDDFWNRKEDIDAIWKALEKDHVLLKAPRRFGKSSIMIKLFEFPQNDFKVFFQDTEKITEPEEFISSIVATLLTDAKIRKLYQSAGKKIKNLVNRIEEIGFGLEDLPGVRIKIKESLKKEWQEEGRKLIVYLQKYKGKVLFILDELPELIKNIYRHRGQDTAVDFLHWFRSIRQMSELSEVRWLVGGSIGIEHVVERIGAGVKTINDFAILRVEPFSEKEGREFIKALLKKEGQLKSINKTILDKLMATIGPPVPHFIQILIKESLYEMNRRNRKTLSDDIISKAYKERVLGPTSRTYFQHYYSRLREYYDSEIERIAKRLLLEIAKQGEVEKSILFKLFNQESKGKYNADGFSYLMTDLENDFYISYKKENDSYYFTLKILRDWWLRYYDLVEE
jgi:hypothetical protein